MATGNLQVDLVPDYPSLAPGGTTRININSKSLPNWAPHKPFLWTLPDGETQSTNDAWIDLTLKYVGKHRLSFSVSGTLNGDSIILTGETTLDVKSPSIQVVLSDSICVQEHPVTIWLKSDVDEPITLVTVEVLNPAGQPVGAYWNWDQNQPLVGILTFKQGPRLPSGPYQINVSAFYHNTTEVKAPPATLRYIDQAGGNGPTSLKDNAELASAIVDTVKGGAASGGGGFGGSSPRNPNDPIPVSLRRSDIGDTADEWLWSAIRNRTEALSFKHYKEYMDGIFCCTDPLRTNPTPFKRDLEMRLPFPGVESYSILKVATELYLMQECGLGIDEKLQGYLTEERRRRDRQSLTIAELNQQRDDYLEQLEKEPTVRPILPYFRVVRNNLSGVPLKNRDVIPPNCYGILSSKLDAPCMLELIWSYWHEEGMLVQALNAISLRFQNRRITNGPDPLASFDIDPLRPLSNLMWGYVRDEQHRLSIPQRAYEYDHHYGISLDGKAVPTLRSADSRSKFLEAFHKLLHLCSMFYKQDDDTTVRADAFPILNGLKEVHLLLGEGAHNQYGDLPWNARLEMMMQQYLLARPEMREFIPIKTMVGYVEPWMGVADSMKRLQGWSDTSVTHFRNLGVFGEQILLSIRFGNWSDVHVPDNAGNWARYWRPEIQGYTHAYRSATGVDLDGDLVSVKLTRDVYAPPSVHLQRRLTEQARPR